MKLAPVRFSGFEEHSDARETRDDRCLPEKLPIRSFRFPLKFKAHGFEFEKDEQRSERAFVLSHGSETIRSLRGRCRAQSVFSEVHAPGKHDLISFFAAAKKLCEAK